MQSPEQRLWRAVLAQAVFDAVSGPPRDRDKARRWLLRPSADLEMVCDAAGIDATVVRARAHLLAYRGWQIGADQRKRIEAAIESPSRIPNATTAEAIAELDAGGGEVHCGAGADVLACATTIPG
jgi:hypothetical protein